MTTTTFSTTSIQDLQALVGSAFTVHTQSGTVELTLVEAHERPRRGLPERFAAPRSLIFSGPRTVLLTQDSYHLDHPTLGRNQWMLVPISKYATLEYAATAAPDAPNLPEYEAVIA